MQFLILGRRFIYVVEQLHLINVCFSCSWSEFVFHLVGCEYVANDRQKHYKTFDIERQLGRF